MNSNFHYIVLLESFNLNELQAQVNLNLHEINHPDSMVETAKEKGMTIETYVTINTTYNAVANLMHYTAIIEYCIE